MIHHLKNRKNRFRLSRSKKHNPLWRLPRIAHLIQRFLALPKRHDAPHFFFPLVLHQKGLYDPALQVLNAFPKSLRQRAIIAMALCCHPRLLIADEPTTAVDVTTQAQVLRLLRQLQRERNSAIVFISILGNTDQQKRGMALLSRHRGRIQGLVGRAVVLKYTPKLKFLMDDSVVRGNRVLQIIDELEKTTPTPSTDQEAE